MESGKKNDRQESSPFEGLQKGLVLHEAKIFNEQQINPRSCCRVLTKILYLLCQGEKFSSDEATGVFFGVTKLFQSHNVALRRMVYLVIKELARGQDNVFVVINCLSKDINSNNDMFRANAIRVFAKVIDASMLGTMERFLKQAVVDRNPIVSSAALVAGQQLFRISPEPIRRWQNEIQEAVNSKSKMVQYHALALLCMVKQHDRLAIQKVVSSLAKRPPRSPLAYCLLIRHIVRLLKVEPDQALNDFLMSCIRNKSSLVVFEAVRGICGLTNVAPHQIQSSIASIQHYLGSTLAIERFAAVRILAEAVSQYPVYVTPCSTDLEMLIQDPNRSIATLAVTTLLKTGVESSIERLMKSISSFMTEISDELRIVLVDAIRLLCLRFPQKHAALMSFLSSILREEGGLEYKSAIVKSILTLMNEIDDAKDAGLEHLCEFIEDCEFPTLAVQILHVLGEEGPKTKTPARYIRFVYNRVILETPQVRAAAIQALAKFGSSCPALSKSCIHLLKRGLTDNDDEVRDRATYCLTMLERQPGDLLQDLNLDWAALEQALAVYLSEPKLHDTPFSLNDVVQYASLSGNATAGGATPRPDAGQDYLANSGAISEPESTNSYLELVNSIPEFAALGPLYKSCKAVELTENEAEYVTSCVKHIFQNHVLLQFNITSYMEGQVLVNATVDLETDGLWNEEMCVPAPLLQFEVGGIVWICLARPEGQFGSVPFPATLKFSVRDAETDASEPGYDDEYELEEVVMLASDFLKPSDVPVSLGDFRSLWDSAPVESEAIAKTALTIDNMQEAVNGIIRWLPVSYIEMSNVVDPEDTTHSVNMVGEFLGGYQVLARAGFMKPKGQSGIVTKVAIRSPDLQLSQIIIQPLM